MGQIQERAKDFLIPLFGGEESILDAHAQKAIATWATLATITGEYLSRKPEKTTFTLQQRDKFRRQKEPPSTIRIWIGRYKRQALRGQWVHVSFPLLSTKDIPNLTPDTVPVPSFRQLLS